MFHVRHRPPRPVCKENPLCTAVASFQTLNLGLSGKCLCNLLLSFQFLSYLIPQFTQNVACSLHWHAHPARFALGCRSDLNLGRPGIPGSNDLETALRRLSMRKANEINEQIINDHHEQEERRRRYKIQHLKAAPICTKEHQLLSFHKSALTNAVMLQWRKQILRLKRFLLLFFFFSLTNFVSKRQTGWRMARGKGLYWWHHDNIECHIVCQLLYCCTQNLQSIPGIH